MFTFSNGYTIGNGGTMMNGGINAPKSTAEVLLYSIDSGRTTGGTQGGWLEDTTFATGGATQIGVGGVVDESQITATGFNIWSDNHYNTHSYLITGLTPGRLHRVEILTMENFYTGAGQRTFSVAINGVSKVTNYDAWAAYNAQYVASDALVAAAPSAADGSGQLNIAITTGNGGQIFGLRIYGK